MDGRDQKKLLNSSIFAYHFYLNDLDLFNACCMGSVEICGYNWKRKHLEKIYSRSGKFCMVTVLENIF